MLHKWCSKGNRKCGGENRTGYQVMNYIVRCVHEVARHTYLHICYSILISGHMQYMATLWCWRC